MAIEVPQISKVVDPSRPVETIEQPGAIRSTSSPAPCTGVALLKHDTLSATALSVQAEKLAVKVVSPTEPTPTAPVTQPGLPISVILASFPVATKTVTPWALSAENAVT